MIFNSWQGLCLCLERHPSSTAASRAAPNYCKDRLWGPAEHSSVVAARPGQRCRYSWCKEQTRATQQRESRRELTVGDGLLIFVNDIPTDETHSRNLQWETGVLPAVPAPVSKISGPVSPLVGHPPERQFSSLANMEGGGGTLSPNLDLSYQSRSPRTVCKHALDLLPTPLDFCLDCSICSLLIWLGSSLNSDDLFRHV